MTITTGTMTREQRKSVALEYFKRLDVGGDLIELMAEDAEVFFPKWGIAKGHKQIGELFGWIGQLITTIDHAPEYLTFIIEDDLVVVEGGSSGIAADGTPWQAGQGAGGRWTDVFEIRDFKIHRCFIYLDPDYANADIDRYPAVVH